ncbi:MAG: VWA domain-containing protein [Deltaproteobacteria bacterium]|nr:VWA domain-containing protein [Deltaproteobacteria bacterium]
MFLDFFYALRQEGIPVSIQEWRALLTSLEHGLHRDSLDRFYGIARACLVKTEAHYDAFDRAFLRVFEGVEGALPITDALLDWLREARDLPELTAEQWEKLKELSTTDLMDQFDKTLREQKERHDGGSRWVGTGGSSPYGNSGRHPSGIRVGGEGRSRSAMKVAESRRYLGYRTDITLDIRQMVMALRRLRQLTRTGSATELDLEETIDKTCRNAGEIELEFRPPRRNDVRLLLMLDVGGTMDPYTQLVGQLLSAMKQTHGLRDFRFYYFHNCIYDRIFTHPWLRRQDSVGLGQLFRELDGRWKLMVVGDAAMHPAELLQSYGNIDHTEAVESTGLDCLQMVRQRYPRAVWMNPDPPRAWGSRSTQVIGKIFPMFHLSVSGLEDAVKTLVGARTDKAA